MGHNWTLPNGIILKPKSLQVYQNDVKLAYHGGGANSNPGPRKEITTFTDESRQRLAFVASNTAIDFTTMITLTYPGEYSSDGKEIKAHLVALLKRLQRAWPIFNYLWFLEFQRRGAPHFHLLLDIPRQQDDIQMLSQAWYDIVGSQDPKHLTAGTRIETVRSKDGARRYAVKYSMKMKQKEVPAEYRNVGRFWGHSRAVKPQQMVPDIPVNDIEDVKRALGEWRYKAALDRPLSILYNAAVDVAEALVIDSSSESI